MGIEKLRRGASLMLPPGRMLATGPGGGTALAELTVPLSAAQITTLNSVPITLIPAPLSTQIILVSQILFQFKYGSVQFTGGGAITFPYHGTSTNVHASTGIANTVIQAAASSITLLPPIAANGVFTSDAGLGVDIIGATADFAAGNSTAIVSLVYSVVTLR